MLGTVLGWVLLLFLLLYCEAAIVVAYGTAAERDSRNCLEVDGGVTTWMEVPPTRWRYRDRLVSPWNLAGSKSMSVISAAVPIIANSID
jgi:hypothetical protein